MTVPWSAGLWPQSVAGCQSHAPDRVYALCRQGASAEWRLLGLYAAAVHLRSSEGSSVGGLQRARLSTAYKSMRLPFYTWICFPSCNCALDRADWLCCGCADAWLPALTAAEKSLTTLTEQLLVPAAATEERSSLLHAVFKALTFLRKSACPAPGQPACWQSPQDESAAHGADCISRVLCCYGTLLRVI